MERLAPQFFAGLNERIAALKPAAVTSIRLDVGSPDMPPAAHIIEGNQASQMGDRHGYQPHNATQALRQAWANMYLRLYNVSLDPDLGVLPLMGSKEGIFHLTMAVVDPGDVVFIPDPGYLTYTQSARMAGGEPYYLPLLPENHYLPDLDLDPGLLSPAGQNSCGLTIRITPLLPALARISSSKQSGSLAAMTCYSAMMLPTAR